MDKQVKILVVDDDNNLRETLADLLEIEGYKVYQAGDGKECLDLVASEFYNVILMDYVLEDGISVFMIDRLRMEGDKETVILVNSALMDDEVPAEDLFEHGADGFISSVGFRADNGGARIANALYNYMQLHGRAALTPHSKH